MAKPHSECVCLCTIYLSHYEQSFFFSAVNASVENAFSHDSSNPYTYIRCHNALHEQISFSILIRKRAHTRVYSFFFLLLLTPLSPSPPSYPILLSLTLCVSHLVGRMAWHLVRATAIKEGHNDHDTSEATEILFDAGRIRILRTWTCSWSFCISTFDIFVTAIRRWTILDFVFVELIPNAETIIVWIAAH